MIVQPYRIDVPDSVLDDLRGRLARLRLAQGIDGGGWDYGTSPSYLRELCDYWQRDFTGKRRNAT